jgi:leucyl/phenylalanyl-tRNA--protein transferase
MAVGTRPTSPFGREASWPRSDLIGVSREFGVGLTLAAYRSGVFPMPADDGLIGWYSPLDRGVLPLDGMRISRSLRKMLRRYRLTVDADFDAVLEGCANPRRPGGWIDSRIRRIYRKLHEEGWVHSVEAWTHEGRLAGGLYGVSMGGLFAGESMFHRRDIGRDASKAALVGLVNLLCDAGGEGRLLDVQWQTPHLASLGVIEISRREYLRRLRQALSLPTPDWANAAARFPYRTDNG